MLPHPAPPWFSLRFSDVSRKCTGCGCQLDHSIGDIGIPFNFLASDNPPLGTQPIYWTMEASGSPAAPSRVSSQKISMNNGTMFSQSEQSSLRGTSGVGPFEHFSVRGGVSLKAEGHGTDTRWGERTPNLDECYNNGSAEDGGYDRAEVEDFRARAGGKEVEEAEYEAAEHDPDGKEKKETDEKTMEMVAVPKTLLPYSEVCYIYVCICTVCTCIYIYI